LVKTAVEIIVEKKKQFVVFGYYAFCMRFDWKTTEKDIIYIYMQNIVVL
jgi:hypothetical protein